MGKPIVQINGDSGRSVRINDANGKTRVDIHGDSDAGVTTILGT